MKNIECRICKSNDTVELNYIPQYKKYILIRCNECGLKFIVSDNYEILSDDLYWDDINKKIYSLQSVINEFKKKHDKFLKIITSKKLPNNNLLDVGSGCGIFVNNATIFGVESIGIEPSKIAVEMSCLNYNANVICGYLTSNSNIKKDFGIITAWDVIEHVEDPVEFVRICRDHLATGGMFLLETPDESSLIRKFINIVDYIKRMFNVNSSSVIYYPSHRYYFTHESIKLLLSNAGFVNINIFKEHSIYSKSYAKYKFYCNCSPIKMLKYRFIFLMLKFPLFWNKQIVLCEKN